MPRAGHLVIPACLGAAVVLGLLARTYWAVATVRGNSMAPTLLDGRRLLVRRVRRAPRRGDRVSHAPGGRHRGAR